MDYTITDTYKRIADYIGCRYFAVDQRVVNYLEHYQSLKVPLFIQESVIKRCLPISNNTFENICDILKNEELFLQMCRTTYASHKKFKEKLGLNKKEVDNSL